MRTLIVLLLTLPMALAAPVPKEVKRPPDAARMEGLWQDGEGRSYWLFRGDKLFVGTTATPDVNGYTYGLTLKPDVSPPEFDTAEVNGTYHFEGIYKFVGAISMWRTTRAPCGRPISPPAETSTSTSFSASARGKSDGTRIRN